MNLILYLVRKLIELKNRLDPHGKKNELYQTRVLTTDPNTTANVNLATELLGL